jgi:hypothetical protein
VDVSPAELIFAVDAGIQRQPAFQEEDQLLAPSTGGDLDDILADSFSGEDTVTDDPGFGKSYSNQDIDGDDRFSAALSRQFDQYVLQFSKVQPTSPGLDQDLESFDNLFPELGFD